MSNFENAVCYNFKKVVLSLYLPMLKTKKQAVKTKPKRTIKKKKLVSQGIIKTSSCACARGVCACRECICTCTNGKCKCVCG
jgi:hypothetical protein